MSLTIDTLQSINGYVCIELRCGQTLVSEELLDGPQVGAAVEEMRGERMPENVRAPLFQFGDRRDIFFHDEVDPFRVHPPAVRGEEDGGAILFRRRPAEQRIPPRAIGDERLFRLAAERYDTVFSPFPQDFECIMLEIDISEIELDEFAEADAASVEQFQDEPVAQPLNGGEIGEGHHRADGGLVEKLRQLFRQPRRDDMGRGIPGQAFVFHEVFEQRPHGRQFPGDAFLTELAFHKIPEVEPYRQLIDVPEFDVGPLKMPREELPELPQIVSIGDDGMFRIAPFPPDVIKICLDLFFHSSLRCNSRHLFLFLYFGFTLYALDVSTLNLKSGVLRRQVEAAINNHVVGQAQLIGLYGR